MPGDIARLIRCRHSWAGSDETVRHLGARNRISRTLWVGCIALAFVGAIATALLLARKDSRPSKSETTEAFLRDVRDANFAKAFTRLCPDEQRAEGQAGFVDNLEQAREKGQGLADYEFSIPFDRESLSARVALGTSRFADGSTGDLTIELGDRKSGGACINSWRL